MKNFHPVILAETSLSTKRVLFYKQKMVINTTSEEETIKAAQHFAASLSLGSIVLLQGDLGAGKSVFCRAIIRHLCDNADMEVPSPTYTLVQNYDTTIGSLWHFDLYRLSDAQEIYELGWEEALADGVMLVEWPERLGALTPSAYTEINISNVAGLPDHRTIEIKHHDTK